MLSPKSIQPIISCRMLIEDTLSHGTDYQTKSITELTQDNFLGSTDYRKVYRNFDYKQSYDTWIYEGNYEDKIVGYKMLQSYPYDTVKFKIGDYVHWNYNHQEFSTWILTSLDTQYLYNVKGRMLLCNNSLKWKDKSGNLNCYPCVIKDALTYTNFKWGNSGVVQSGGDIVVVVQRNKYTSSITVNDRFIFNSAAFRVKQLFDELNPDYLQLYMMKIPELSEDDLTDNIAINENPTHGISTNGIVLTPKIEEILTEETISFSVYNYIENIKQDDIFDVSISKVPAENYELNIIDGNNFTIKNIKQYNSNTMQVECVDKTTGNKIIKEIWLGGNW